MSIALYLSFPLVVKVHSRMPIIDYDLNIICFTNYVMSSTYTCWFISAQKRDMDIFFRRLKKREKRVVELTYATLWCTNL